MSDLFKLKETKYNLRNGSVLVSSNMKTTTYGINSITLLAPNIWEFVPIKISKSLNIFKHKIIKSKHGHLGIALLPFVNSTYQTWDMYNPAPYYINLCIHNFILRSSQTCTLQYIHLTYIRHFIDIYIYIYIYI